MPTANPDRVIANGVPDPVSAAEVRLISRA